MHLIGSVSRKSLIVLLAAKLGPGDCFGLIFDLKSIRIMQGEVSEENYDDLCFMNIIQVLAIISIQLFPLFLGRYNSYTLDATRKHFGLSSIRCRERERVR